MTLAISVAWALLAFVFVQAVVAQSSVPTYIKYQSMSLALCVVQRVVRVGDRAPWPRHTEKWKRSKRAGW
jgi:hypothetical protein